MSSCDKSNAITSSREWDLDHQTRVPNEKSSIAVCATNAFEYSKQLIQHEELHDVIYRNSRLRRPINIESYPSPSHLFPVCSVASFFACAAGQHHNTRVRSMLTSNIIFLPPSPKDRKLSSSPESISLYDGKYTSLVPVVSSLPSFSHSRSKIIIERSTRFRRLIRQSLCTGLQLTLPLPIHDG